MKALALALTALVCLGLLDLQAAAKPRGKQQGKRPPVAERATSSVAPEQVNSPLVSLGLADVTAAPFLADPSGQKDATEALLRAMEFARQRKLTLYFPAGVYTVSNTLEYSFNRAAAKGGEDSSCQILGARGGAKRARIVLAPHSPGFDKPGSPKPVVHIWAQSRENPTLPQPNISMNNLLLNVDLEIGPGNPGAIGIHHDAAQGSGIEDVTVYAGDGYAGIVGLQAGGGGTHHVTVIGGRYGLDASESKAAGATVSGATFIGQQECAIRCNGLETVSFVGCRVVVPKGVKGPAIRGEGSGATKGTMTIVDTEISFESADPANIAIGSNRSLYLNNVWVRGCGKVFATSDGGFLDNHPGGWQRILECAHAVRPPKLTDKWNVQLEHVSYVDGRRIPSDVILKGEAGVAPPADLQSRHVWEGCPAWDAPGVANVKAAPYNAKGNGNSDDTAALQKAIDENEVVFFPKGTYSVTKTLRLRPQSKLVGLRRLSVIKAQFREGGSFGDPKNPQPILRTADDANAETVVAYLSLAWDQEHPDTCTMLDWRAGRISVVRSIYVGTGRCDNYLSSVAGNGGGRWYSLFKAARMRVEGTREPLRIYQLNPEWGPRPHLFVTNAQDVTIYGFKNEGPNAAAILDSDNINVFGYGGNANAAKGKALFNIERTSHLRLAGLMDRVNKEGTPPTEWFMVSEKPSRGPALHTEPLDRIILFKRD
jgi:hypothetical protein